MHEKDIDFVRQKYPNNTRRGEPTYLPTIFPIMPTLPQDRSPTEIGLFWMPIFTLKPILAFILKEINGEKVEEKDLWPHQYIDHEFDAEDPRCVTIHKRCFVGLPYTIEEFSKKLKDN